MNPLPERADQQGLPAQPPENNGFLFGSLCGVLLGVLISGPHFVEWMLWEIVGVSASCAVVTGLMCHLAIAATRTTPGTSNAVYELTDFSLLDQDGGTGDD